MKFNEKLLLLAIIILGFFFRIYGINFDEHCCQHPDERAIVMFALPITFPSNVEQFLSPDSPLNPHFFAYGNLPLYVLRGASLAAGNIDKTLTTYDRINLVGRIISIVADLLTIITIFLIGRTLFNSRVGIASSFVYSIAILPIQYSHFFTADILLTFFITLTLLRAIKFYKAPQLTNAALLGISFGLALATKISAIPLIFAVSCALAADFFFVFIKTPHKINSWIHHIPPFVKKLVISGAIIAAFTLVTFVISQPYALIDSGEFIKQNLAQSQMTRDAYTFPYTLQYVGKVPYIYETINIFLWGLGPIVTIFVAAGIFIVIRTLKSQNQQKKAEILIVLVFCFVYFLLVGKFAIGFMRYMIPIYPILSLFAGIAILKLFEKQNKSIVKFGVLLAMLIWPISFISIYSRTNTRIEASRWIHKNIPAGSTLATEHWDDRLPLVDSSEYTYQELNLYDQPDDTHKWTSINEKIKTSNYIILASNRLYVPIQKLNDCRKYKVCYPIASKYYQDLFSGKLGYTKIAEITSYPTIPFFNIAINDTSADESFTVYDHPKIFIYKNNNPEMRSLK